MRKIPQKILRAEKTATLCFALGCINAWRVSEGVDSEDSDGFCKQIWAELQRRGEVQGPSPEQWGEGENGLTVWTRGDSEMSIIDGALGDAVAV